MLKLDELEDRENLPRGTLTAVMRAESGGKSTVVSPAGAGGLFQLMPATAASYKADRFDPQQSADAAAKELGSHYQRYDGDLQQTLAAWNWGSGNLQKQGLANAPAETKGFIPRVLKWLGPGSAEAADASIAGQTAQCRGSPDREQVGCHSPWQASECRGHTDRHPRQRPLQQRPQEGVSGTPPSWQTPRKPLGSPSRPAGAGPPPHAASRARRGSCASVEGQLH